MNSATVAGGVRISENDGESVYAEVTVASTPEGGSFIGPDNEAPTYDDDGNLLADARWDYAWTKQGCGTFVQWKANGACGIQNPFDGKPIDSEDLERPPRRKKLRPSAQADTPDILRNMLKKNKKCPMLYRAHAGVSVAP